MDKIRLDLHHCYGIKRLEHSFDFTVESAYAIYAPNGSMKSSLAQVFADIAAEKVSVDRIYADRETIRNIVDENGDELAPNSVLVVPPYDADLSNDEDVAVLLADAKLSKEFEEIRRGINRAEDELLRALRDQSKSKKELRSEIAAAIIPGGGDLSTALKRIQSELRDQKDAPFADIEYDRVFEEKALSFLSQPNARSLVKSYVERYNELLDTSKYFKRGIFDYYNASTIAKTLAVNGFFEAKHTVNLNAEEPKLITNKKDLEAVIAAEKSAILADKELRSAFDALEKLMDKNVALRSFRDYLMDHVELLPKLANAAGFKQELWKSYLKENYGLYRRVIDEYAAASEKEEAIRKEAAKQRTQWEDVIGIFNSRFPLCQHG